MSRPDPAVSYTVLASPTPSRYELEIKKSRFLAVLTRVTDEEAARAAVAAARREFPDARHHCSAFVLGPARDTARSSDDGEPAGTAGVPMLQALTGHATSAQRRAGTPGDLSDVCAVVVRWFGGVKLGAGGLVRAYSAAVSAALERADLVTRLRARSLGVRVPHADAGRVEDQLRGHGFTLEPTTYDAAAAALTVLVPDRSADVTEAVERITALTAGRFVPEPGGASWHDIAASPAR